MTSKVKELVAAARRAQGFITRVDDLHQTIYSYGLDEDLQDAISAVESEGDGAEMTARELIDILYSDEYSEEGPFTHKTLQRIVDAPPTKEVR